MSVRRRLGLLVMSLAVAATVVTPALAVTPPVVPAGPVGDIAGSGATFPALLYKALQAKFTLANPSAGIAFSYSSVGSGAGIKNFYGSDARKSSEMFGASDAILSDAEKASVIGAVGSYYMIPMALGPLAVVYNLPGLKQRISSNPASPNYRKYRKATLYLDGATLGKIYAGIIGKWNDAAIKKTNPLIVNLPSSSIIPVFRSDGSGTTFIFTSYLNKVSATWSQALGNKPSKTLGDKISTMASKAHAVGAPGNEGVSATIGDSKNTIGYVELGYALQLGLTAAYMRTGDTPKAYYVPPTVSGAQAAAAAAYKAGTADDPVDPGTIESGLFYQPVNQKGSTSYPITGYTWVLVYGEYKGANDPGLARVQTLIAWLYYNLTTAQSSYSRLGYAPLPPAVATAAIGDLQKIMYNGSVVWSGN
jgi:phosphate transport system substrate-binding protein